MAPKLPRIGEKARDEFKKQGIKADRSKTGANYIRSIGVGRPSKKK